MSTKEVRSLIKPLETLLKFLKEAGIKHIVIGGVAAGILGKPRFTADIDTLIFLEKERLKDFLKKAEKRGIISRIERPLEFAESRRVLLLKHSSTGVNIDISLGILPFEIESLKRATVFSLGNMELTLPTPEDLIIMKAVAHRPIDLQDIRNILAVNPRVDFKRIISSVKEFSEVLEMPEILNDLKSIFKESR